MTGGGGRAEVCAARTLKCTKTVVSHRKNAQKAHWVIFEVRSELPLAGCDAGSAEASNIFFASCATGPSGLAFGGGC